MAITAAITLAPTTANTGQPVTVTCTITNSGGTAVSVIGVQPNVAATTKTATSVPVLLGQPFTGPGATLSVAGSSGTLAMTWGAAAMGPHVANYGTNPFPLAGVGGSAIVPLPPIAEPQQQLYDFGATVYTSDGSVTTATVGTLTVNAAPKP